MKKKILDLKCGDEIHYYSNELTGYTGKSVAMSGTILDIISLDTNNSRIKLEMGRELIVFNDSQREVVEKKKVDERRSAMVSSVGTPRMFKGISLE